MMVRCCTPCMRRFRRQRLGESKPLLPIIVSIREEVLVDEDPQLCPEAAGRRDEDDHQQCSEQQHDLHRPAPAAAHIAHECAGCGDHEKKSRRHDQCGGVEHHLPRHVHLDGPPRVAGGRGGKKWNQQRIGETATAPDRFVQPAEQERVGVEVEIEGEEPGERDASGRTAQRASGGARRRSCSTINKPAMARPSRGAIRPVVRMDSTCGPNGIASTRTTLAANPATRRATNQMGRARGPRPPLGALHPRATRTTGKRTRSHTARRRASHSFATSRLTAKTRPAFRSMPISR